MRPTPGLPVGCLAFLLAVWEPVSLASAAAGSLGRLLGFGVPALALLLAKVLLAGLGLVAGRALWQASPEGLRLAQAWLALAALLTVVTYLTPYFPSSHVPGLKAVHLAGVLLHHLAWYLYLVASPRVRAAFADEEQASNGRPEAIY